MSLIQALGIKWNAAGPKSKALTLGLAGLAGAVIAYLPAEIVSRVMSENRNPGSFFDLLVAIAAWMAVYGIGFSLSLGVGQNRYLHRPVFDAQEVLRNVAGGFGIGLVSGAFAQAFFAIAVESGGGSVFFIEGARVVAWGMFGALIGFGMSFLIPNLGRVHAIAGGGVGALVGAIGFIACAAIFGDAVGRFVGLGVVGWALGYAIGLVEEKSRVAWLQVGYGSSRETVKISLGATPVCVGSDSQRCAVWAKGARAIALRFRFSDGVVTCDDLANERSFAVPAGFEQQVGTVYLSVHTAAESRFDSPLRQPSAAVPSNPSPVPVPPANRGASAVASISRSGPPSRSAVAQTQGSRVPPPPPPPPPRAK